MARGKVTELLGKAGENITQRILTGSKKTEVMDSSRSTGVTWIMSESENGNPVSIEQGTVIEGYVIERILSENTGEATLLQVNKENKLYVLKLYHKNKTPKQELLQVLESMNTPYVIKSVDRGTYYDRFFEVLPFYESGDLTNYLPFQDVDIEKIIVPCVNEGLKALHDKDIIHRDIKPSNLFYDKENNSVIIGDFGISSVLNSDVSVRATSMSRTLGYSAPETSNGFISKESDYYSFGITIYHLVMGVDPFSGMSDMQILYQTINKKLEIPQSISPRIKELIKGLTVKDRNYRWGYNEVNSWIRGVHVEINDAEKENVFERPYKFLNESYYDLTSLSMAFAQNWDNAKKHLYRGLIDKYLANFDEEMASKCIDFKEMKNKDLAVFNMIYLLNPNAPLCYMGDLYNDLESLGNRMLVGVPSINREIYSLIVGGGLEKYLTMNKYDANLVQIVSEVRESLIEDDNSDEYFKLMFILDPSIGFTIGGFRCEDLQDLIDYLDNIDYIARNNIAMKLVDNRLFIAWVKALGYENQVNQWLDVYKGVEW